MVKTDQGLHQGEIPLHHHQQQVKELFMLKQTQHPNHFDDQNLAVVVTINQQVLTNLDVK